MGGSSDKDGSGEAGGARAVDPEPQPGRGVRAELEAVKASRARRNRLLAQDALGRTPLFYAAENGRMEEVREIIFSFGGTGLSPARLSVITTKDHSGLTAADVAEQNGHEEIASLLRSEEVRMEYYE
jgi:hypothetical protein